VPRTSDPTARLARLRAARKSIGRKRPVLSAVPMAEMAGMTWAGLRKHIDGDAAFPIKGRGGNGIEWEFDARKVLDHLIGKLERDVAKKRARTRRMAEIAGFDPDTLPDESLGIADLAKIDSILTSVQRKKTEQGHYVVAAKADRAAADFIEAVVEAFMGAVQRMDPTGSLPASVRQKLDNEMRDGLVRIHDAAVRWREGIGATSQSGATRARS